MLKEYNIVFWIKEAILIERMWIIFSYFISLIYEHKSEGRY